MPSERVAPLLRGCRRPVERVRQAASDRSGVRRLLGGFGEILERQCIAERGIGARCDVRPLLQLLLVRREAREVLRRFGRSVLLAEKAVKHRECSGGLLGGPARALPSGLELPALLDGLLLARGKAGQGARGADDAAGQRGSRAGHL